MKNCLIIFVLFLINLKSYGQNNSCNQFYPLEKVKHLTYETTNDKDKITSTNEITYSNFKKIPSGVQVDVTSTTTNQTKKKNNTSISNFELVCKDGVITIDLKQFLTPEMFQPSDGLEVKMKQNFLELPNDLSVGKELNNGNLEIEIYSNGMRLNKSELKIENRKIDSKETITTPLGSFEAYKISMNVTYKSIFSLTYKVEEYYVKEIGMIKSVLINKKGAITSTTNLIKYE